MSDDTPSGPPALPAYEKLGAFYLGRLMDESGGEPSPVPFLYDPKDLVTHALCVGMTGSGKTGPGVGILEEAALDGVPALVIDPKGDMGNLLLTFPELAAEDFEPWVDPREAAGEGRTVAEQTAAEAELWRGGLADWDQDGERIRRLRRAAAFALYTPGSSEAAVPDAVEAGPGLWPRVRAGDPEPGGSRLQGPLQHRYLVPQPAADPARQGPAAGRVGRRRR